VAEDISGREIRATHETRPLNPVNGSRSPVPQSKAPMRNSWAEGFCHHIKKEPISEMLIARDYAD
jgi:hypothetical protein